MKKTALLILMSPLFFGSTFLQEGMGSDSCNATESRQKCKKALEPFKYDAGKVVRIDFKDREQQQEFEIPLYIGERYRFVFQKEGLPLDVEISVYDKQIGSKNRTQLFTTKGMSFDEKQIIWEPEKSRRVFVHFDIPATTETDRKGCVVLLLGYAI